MFVPSYALVTSKMTVKRVTVDALSTLNRRMSPLDAERLVVHPVSVLSSLLVAAESVGGDAPVMLWVSVGGNEE